MASKRNNTRASKLTKSKDYNALNLSDVLCPICRSILVEPVSLPCNHEFCLFCFEGTMQNANLVCPLCRLRVGSWLRKVKKDKKLINGELWKAIKDRFPQHVKNKLNGVDENIDEKREIIVSYPGEIRKEYELQKQKEDEEQNKVREAELKASEELIDKLNKEDDYERAVMEEKLKLDEELAKKLENELASKHPSTSKIKTYKKLGPLDKFIKKGNETATNNTFLNKEYTCRVLCLDSGTGINESSVKEMSPKIQKRIHQLQKIVDLEATSDSSDCIESEMRYFKPIDYRLNPPSQKTTPVKVTPKKISQDAATKVLSPGGIVKFSPNILSAFAKVSINMPILLNASKSSPISSPQSSQKETCHIKRTLPSSDDDVKEKKIKKTDTNPESQGNYKAFPTLGYNNLFPAARKKLFGKVVEIQEKSVESPPFFGFDRTKLDHRKLVKPLRKNGNYIQESSQVRNLKKEQEQADLEFAKRLQEEINKSHYTRSSRSVGVSKRQKTLDEMIKSPYRVK